MRLRISAIASMLGVAAFLAACDFSSTDNQSRTLSPAEAAARAQATIDSATKYKDSLVAARKADSLAWVAQKATWKTDSAGFITAAKTALDKWKSDSAKAVALFKKDSAKGAKQHAKDSAAWAKDSLAGVKTLSKDSAAWAKKKAADSGLYEKAVAAMAKKYTADSTALQAVHTKFLALLGKDSAAIVTAQTAVDGDNDSTKASLKSAHAKALEKANAKLAADQLKYDAAVAKATLKITTDSTKGEEAKTKAITKRATDSTTAATKYTKDSTTVATKVAGRVTTWNTNDAKDSTLRAADTAAYNLKSRLKDTAKIKKDSADSGKRYADSVKIVSADSSFLVRKAVPVFSVAGGSYGSSQTVALTTAFPSGRIFYTLDGSNPDSTKVTSDDPTKLYSSALTVAVGKTIKAQAFLKGYAASRVFGQVYVIDTAGVTIASATDTTGDSVRVQFKGEENGTDFYYTLNNVDPTTTTSATCFKVSAAATKDTVSILMGKSDTVRVIAAITGRSNSKVLTKGFRLTMPTPTFSNANDTTAKDSVWVKITAGTATGATLRYTTTGTAPTATTGTVIATGDSVKLSTTSTLKAIAYRAGSVISATKSKTATIEVTDVVNDLSAGEIDTAGGKTIHLSTTTVGADIYYTKDNSTPTGTASATCFKYSSSTGVPLTAAMTLKAIAVKTGCTSSAVNSKAYTIKAVGG